MVRRETMAWLAVVMLGFGLWMAQQTRGVADAAERPAPKPAPAVRAGFVSLSVLMKNSKRWQKAAATMNLARDKEVLRLKGLQDEITNLTDAMSKADEVEKDRLSKEVLKARRKFEDAERTVREDLDTRSKAYLKSLYDEVNRLIAELAKERNLDFVFGAPLSLEQNPEPKNETAYLDMYFRPPAVNALYVRDSVDLTGEILKRMNAAFDAETDG